MHTGAEDIRGTFVLLWLWHWYPNAYLCTLISCLTWWLWSKAEVCLGSCLCAESLVAVRACKSLKLANHVLGPQSSEYSEWQRDGVRSGHRKAIWLSGEDRTARYWSECSFEVLLCFFYVFFSVELLLPMFWISWWRFWKPNCKDSSEVFTWEFVGIEGPSKDRSSFCKLSIIVYIFLSSDIFRIMPLESVWPGLRHPPVSQYFTCMHHLLRCHDPFAQYSSHLWL